MAHEAARTEIVEAEGHLVDSQLLNAILDKVIERQSKFEVLRFDLGRTNEEFSSLELKVTAPDAEALRRLLEELMPLGCHARPTQDAALRLAEADGVVPDDFYSTTNHRTFVRCGGRWVPVGGQRMDAVIVVQDGAAACRKLRDVGRGDSVVCGVAGIRVSPEFQERDRLGFAFMKNDVSSERRVEVSASKVVAMMRNVKASGGRIAFVAGPVVVHSGGGSYFGELIRRGYVDVLLAGNALAVHDVEHALYGTSLGVDLDAGVAQEAGHRNHLCAINAINRVGGLSAAVESGVLRSGVMYELVTRGIPFVLAGSIRDDGPLVDTEMNLIEAQERYARALEGIAMVVMLSTMLHSIGVGNMLASHVAHRLRRYQPGGGHQAERPRLIPGGGHRDRRRAVPAPACDATAGVRLRAPRTRQSPARRGSGRGRPLSASTGSGTTGIVVQKYGGTSVATAERISAIADRVGRCIEEEARSGLIVVLSAMGKSTDQLVALAHEVSRRPAGREMDLLLASGEQVSVSLLGLALQDRGIPAISLTAAQCGIRTDDAFNIARIQSIDTGRINAEIAAGRVVIITGFQGINSEHEITTPGAGRQRHHGRGGRRGGRRGELRDLHRRGRRAVRGPQRGAASKALARAELRSCDRDGVQRCKGSASAGGRTVHGVRRTDSRAVELSQPGRDVDSREREDGDGAGGSSRGEQRPEDRQDHAARRAGRAGSRGAGIPGSGG